MTIHGTFMKSFCFGGISAFAIVGFPYMMIKSVKDIIHLVRVDLIAVHSQRHFCREQTLSVLASHVLRLAALIFAQFVLGGIFEKFILSQKGIDKISIGIGTGCAVLAGCFCLYFGAPISAALTIIVSVGATLSGVLSVTRVFLGGNIIRA